MSSIKRRLWLALAVAIVLVWCVFFSMLSAYQQYGPGSPWKQGLEQLGGALLQVLPDRLVQSLEARVPPAIADDSAEPGNIVTALALNTLQLLAVGVLLAGSVVVSLRPLRRLSRQVAQRLPSDTSAIPVHQVPREIAPLVTAFNSLLVRVEGSVQAERDFIAQAAHELRTPMSALHTWAEAALLSHDPAEKDALLRQLIQASIRTSRLADQLLDQARLEAGPRPGQWTDADLGELALHLIGEFDAQASTHWVRLTASLSPCRTRCDVDAIGILLRNLLDNAIRHGGAGGVVEVRCGYHCDGSSLYPYLEVADNGPGIAEAELAQVFERFYRLPGSQASGSGIGLALVSTIAAQHGAVIECSQGLQGAGLCVRTLFKGAPTANNSRISAP